MEKEGFTLIELLVVMSIMVIVATGIGFSLNLNNPKNRAETGAKVLASDIKRARDLTLNRKIDSRCLAHYGAASQRDCLRYKVVMPLGSSENEYAILPQAVNHEDESLIRNRFGDTIRSLGNGAKFHYPSEQEELLFDYSPSSESSIEVVVTYSAAPLSCIDSVGEIGPLVVTDTQGENPFELLVNCRGRVNLESSER